MAGSLSAPPARTIALLNVAASGPDAPRPPGVRTLPQPGTALVSPALRDLLHRRDGATVQLPARVTGVLGIGMLHDPRELVVVAGYDVDTLRRLDPSAYVVESFPRTRVLTSTVVVLPITLLVTIVFLLPLLVFVGSAARLGARRREERLKVMRLVGATPGQVRVVAAVEATVAGLIGLAAGILFALAVRAWLVAHGTYAASELPASPLRLLAFAAAVPVISSISAPVALRRVGMSPLAVEGSSRRRIVSAWRWWPLALSWTIVVCGAALAATSSRWSGFLVTIGVVGVALGLIGAGPWLVQRLGQVVDARATRATPLLAARRLTTDPRAGFRPMTVLVVIMFVTTMVLVIVPAAKQSAYRSALLQASSRVTAHPDLTLTWRSSEADARLASVAARDRLARLHGVTAVVPLQLATDPQLQPGSLRGGVTYPGDFSLLPDGGGVAVADCTTFAAAVHSSNAGCRPGVLVAEGTGHRIGEPMTLETGSGPVTLTVQGVLRLLDRTGVVALVPPELAPPGLTDPRSTGALWIATDRTASTARQVQSAVLAAAPGSRLARGRTPTLHAATVAALRWFLYTILALVILLAACSLAVTVVDQIFDRRRSLATLRALGTPLTLFRRVTVLEVGAPLIVATAFGALNGVVMGFTLAVLGWHSIVVPWFDVLAVPALVAAAWLIVSAIGAAALGRAAPRVPLRTG